MEIKNRFILFLGSLYYYLSLQSCNYKIQSQF